MDSADTAPQGAAVVTSTVFVPEQVDSLSPRACQQSFTTTGHVPS